MIEWGQKSKPKKISRGFSNKPPQKSLGQKLTQFNLNFRAWVDMYTQGVLCISSNRNDRMGAKNQNPKESLGEFQQNPQKIPGAKINPI